MNRHKASSRSCLDLDIHVVSVVLLRVISGTKSLEDSRLTPATRHTQGGDPSSLFRAKPCMTSCEIDENEKPLNLECSRFFDFYLLIATIICYFRHLTDETNDI